MKRHYVGLLVVIVMNFFSVSSVSAQVVADRVLNDCHELKQGCVNIGELKNCYESDDVKNARWTCYNRNLSFCAYKAHATNAEYLAGQWECQTVTSETVSCPYDDARALFVCQEKGDDNTIKEYLPFPKPGDIGSSETEFCAEDFYNQVVNHAEDNGYAYCYNSTKIDDISDYKKPIQAIFNTKSDLKNGILHQDANTIALVNPSGTPPPPQDMELAVQTPNSSSQFVKDLAKQLSGNCGGAGASCCDPDLKGLEDMEAKDITGQGGALFNIFASFLKSIFKDIVGDIKTTATMVAENKTPCSDTLKLELMTTDKGKVIAENIYIPPDNQKQTGGMYVVKKTIDCSEISDEHYKLVCMDKPLEYEEKIPKSTVIKDGCTCVDLEAPPTSSIDGSTIKEFKFTAEEIRSQIINSQPNSSLRDKAQACLESEENNKFWPPRGSAEEGNCLNQVDAEKNLREWIDGLNNSRSSAGTGNLYAKAGGADNEGNVLSATSLCTGLDDTIPCLQCLFTGMFWNRGGCTAEALYSRSTLNLCRNLPSTGSNEKARCEDCVFVGGIWTGIGCIFPDLRDIIERHIFGIGLGFSGVISLFCIIFASFRMQTSAGDPEKVKQAQELITSCITGLIIVIFAVVILQVIGVDILRIPGLV